MFVLPKPDPWVLDMEIIFFFGNVLKSGIRYLIAMETLKYPVVTRKHQTIAIDRFSFLQILNHKFKNYIIYFKHFA
jgi:hypothetical protein